MPDRDLTTQFMVVDTLLGISVVEGGLGGEGVYTQSFPLSVCVSVCVL